MKQSLILFFLHLLLFNNINADLGAQVSVQQSNGEWELLIDGDPFEVKGVTVGYEKDVEHYSIYFEDLQFLGVNTIRTWGTGKNTPALLDAAHTHGMKVMVGIWMRHGRPGMEDDDSFDYLTDVEGMQVMYDDAIRTVEQYKDHPAVLTWGVGNEVYLNTATDEEKKAYSLFLEKVCSKIKELDPNHPIASVEAWTFGMDWWSKYVPSIDIYGLNIYGGGVALLADEMKKRGINKPYIITEYGVAGEWDIKEVKHGVKREPTDQEKYDAITMGYTEWIKDEPSCLGVYFFNYNDGNDFLSAWLNTHFNGMARPAYWATREAYTGKKAIDHLPIIEKFELPDQPFDSETWVPVTLRVTDYEDEVLYFDYYYNQRTGSRKRRDQILPLETRVNKEGKSEIKMPKEDGGIKVYACITDTYGNMGMASTAVLVRDEEAAKKKYLVPRVKFPFFVYQDNEELPYFPSGYMGNYDAMEVDLNHTRDVYEGNTAIKIRYKDRQGWYGLGFVDPVNDWGEILGGYDLTGAKEFSFYARSNFDKVSATIGFGLIDDDKPFPDTARKSIDIKLSTKWKKYTIKIKDEDMSCIRSGLVIFSSGRGFQHEIYLDKVVFE